MPPLSTAVPTSQAVPTAGPTATAVPLPTPMPTSTPEPANGPTPEPGEFDVVPVEVRHHVPAGHALLAHAVGDLDNDGDDDLAVVVHLEGDADIGTELAGAARPLLLFLRNEDGTFDAPVRSDTAVLCGRCGGVWGDPWSDISIDAGRVALGHYGGSNWRWTHRPVFAFDQELATWVLVEVGASSFHAADPDTTFEDHTTTVDDFGLVTLADYEHAWG